MQQTVTWDWRHILDSTEASEARYDVYTWSALKQPKRSISSKHKTYIDGIWSIQSIPCPLHFGWSGRLRVCRGLDQARGSAQFFAPRLSTHFNCENYIILVGHVFFDKATRLVWAASDVFQYIVAIRMQKYWVGAAGWRLWSNLKSHDDAYLQLSSLKTKISWLTKIVPFITQ